MALNILASISLGCLTGFLLGLSVSPVIGSLLGAIIAGTMVFLTLIPEKEERKASELDASKLVRIIVFSISTLMFALIGIKARVDSWIGSPVIEQQFESFKKIGISPKDARQAILERYKGSPISQNSENSTLPVVFNSVNVQNICRDFDISSYGDSASILAKFEGFDEPWSNVEKSGILADSLQENDKVIVLRTFHTTICKTHLSE